MVEEARLSASILRKDSDEPQAVFRLLAGLNMAAPNEILSLPFYYNERVLGFLVLLGSARGAFTAKDVTFGNRLSTLISRSLYNSRLVQELNVANAELEVNRWQLINSRNTLRALFDSVPISIYIIDRDYKLVAVNMQKAKTTTFHPKRLVGEKCYQAIYGNQDICPGCRLHETLYHGKSLNMTKRDWEHQHRPLEWDVNTFPIMGEDNQPVQAIVFEEDVTEKRRLEAHLVQSEKLAAVGQLAAGIAHEINNPLTAILANAEMLARELPSQDDRQEMVELIAEAGSRASKVVRNLLDIVRVEQHTIEPVDVNRSITSALKLLQHKIVSHSVDLIFQPAEDLPTISASEEHLQGVWLNLVSNAIDALGEGRNQIKITTSKNGNHLQVVVADTGQGIPPENLAQIFEPFYTTKSSGQGTGLGLSTCHRVIKQLGGMIHVDSVVDKGTQFTIVLPISLPKRR